MWAPWDNWKSNFCSTCVISLLSLMKLILHHILIDSYCKNLHTVNMWFMKPIQMQSCRQILVARRGISTLNILSLCQQRHSLTNQPWFKAFEFWTGPWLWRLDMFSYKTLQRRHNEGDGVSNYQSPYEYVIVFVKLCKARLGVWNTGNYCLSTCVIFLYP